MSYGPEGFSALRDMTEDQRADLESPGRCECCRQHIEGEPVIDQRDPRLRFCSEPCRAEHCDETTGDVPAWDWERAVQVMEGRAK